MKSEQADTGLKSVLTTLDILELVAMEPAEIGVSEVANRIGVAKGGVYKHLQTLAARGYLWQNPETSKYRAGIGCYLLGRAAAENVGLVAAAEQPMKNLRDAFGLTVTLAVPKGVKALVIERIFGTMPMEIGDRPGTEFPVNASSQGKVFLAFGEPAVWEKLENSELEKLTDHSIMDVRQLRQQCEQVKVQGWAVAPEEALIGICAMSAPVFDANSNCVAALTLVGSIQHIKRTPSYEQTSKLIEEAQAISYQLGYKW